MKNIITIKTSLFQEELDKQFGKDQNISTRDVIDTFLKVLEKNTNVLRKSDLHVLVLKQCKKNCKWYTAA